MQAGVMPSISGPPVFRKNWRMRIRTLGGPRRIARLAQSHTSLDRTACEGASSLLLLPSRSPGQPVHKRLHLLLGHLAILVAVHCLENAFMSGLKLLQ